MAPEKTKKKDLILILKDLYKQANESKLFKFIIGVDNDDLGGRSELERDKKITDSELKGICDIKDDKNSELW